MTSGGKSLTDPPTNLREAIDWVLRVSNNDGRGGEDGSSGLAEAVEKLLPSDSENIGTLKGKLKEVIANLAGSLKTFIGYQRVKENDSYKWKIGENGIVKPGVLTSVYTSAYYGYSWFTDVSSNDYDGSKRRKGVQCFFTAIEKIYEGLTEIYLKCKKEWKTENLGGSNLKQFMEKNGFSGTQLNTDMTGNQIITKALQGLTEFSTAYIAAGPNTSLDAFRYQLEQNAMSSPSEFPLTALYILATYPFIHPYQTVLLLPSNLKEAIDWVLRVTRRDGQDGHNSGNEQKLVKAVMELPDFKDAITAAAEKFKDSGNVNVIQALKKLKDEGTLGEIIKKLTNGLKAFTGYGGGQGIANVIDPLQQLRKGVLLFFDEKRAHEAVNKAMKDTSAFNDAIVKVSGITETRQITEVVKALKDVTNLKDKNGVNELAHSFKQYLDAVLGAVKTSTSQASGQVESLCQKLSSLLVEVGKQNAIKTHIAQVKEANRTLESKRDQGNGGWENMAFNGSGGFALKHFLVGEGYNGSYLTTTRGFKGSDIVNLIGSLDQFSNVSSSPNPSHTDMLTELDNSLKGVIDTGSSSAANLNGHSLSALFQLCRCYFAGKQIMKSKVPNFKPRPPTSIREMLYWLAGLQFSPHYSSIEKQIAAYIPNNGLHVADSAINTSNNMITQNQMKGYLLSSCLSAPGVLGAIQGNSADTEEGEPWLHSLFCNTMNLQYPSGAALFTTLANYSYALQFQLYFLYIQCRTNHNQSYGWQWCRYGQGVGSSSSNDANELASWICSAPDCSRGYSCQHNSEKCQHFNKCGQSDKRSPLQAFLTDNLKGFHVSQKPDADSTHHLNNHPPGYMCHVKMGFASALTTDANATGWYIYYLIEHFCSGSKTPLRQLCEKLSCLTKRTPRTLGDLFGFLWHLNGQLFRNTRPKMAGLIEKLAKAFGLDGRVSGAFNNRYSDFIELWNHIAKLNTGSSSSSATGLSLSLESMVSTIPFLYQLFLAEEEKSLPVNLFDLTQHCHETVNETGVVRNQSNQSLTVIKHKNSGCSETNDLWSIFQSLDTKPTGNNTDTQADCRSSQCGGYLSPLTHTYGIAYSPKFATTYLSWVVYLVEVFNERLDELLTEFNNINCKDCAPNCSCTEGQHGTTNCSCQSVVSCAGVLPVLYAHGLNFTNAYALKGGTNGTDSMKRNCQNFQMALSNVLSTEAPLTKLLTTIDDFLYMFRIYFFYNLSSFWIMYVCIVLYIYFLRADLLHLKSHVHFPSSHGIPSIGLLTTGKSTILTKLSNLAYFMP
ncbi:extracellular matrix-binding ebh [Babesia caballi]|uniref:Extracellular matrix-binding ebh n=1 Tax=Babesia caballi TaxID=5871 RepID=A0AAV4LNH1_BABCB|nr:extracellular matrix-binding ebh [Babesia caballi]